MVRFWRESEVEGWHATAQSTATARVYHFATVESLFDFLRGEMARQHEIGGPADGWGTPMADSVDPAADQTGG
jgi:hypothetical protein